MANGRKHNKHNATSYRLLEKDNDCMYRVKAGTQTINAYRNNVLFQGCSREVLVRLKEYECVQVAHHKDVGKRIEEWQKKGWRLNSHQAVGTQTIVNHYLLFEKGE